MSQSSGLMNAGTSKLMVSIIIVSWNAKDHLVRCLASISSAACRYPMEIIVVDNDSRDGSAECVESCYPHVRLIRTDANLGFARANNIGISASTGRYLCLINSDVKVLPDCITRLVDYCEKHLTVGMAGPRVIGRDGKLQRSCRGFPTVWNMFCRSLALDSIFPGCRLFTGYALRHWAQNSLCPVDVLTGCFWLIRRKALDRVGLLDESFFMYGEDVDWCTRFWKAGWHLVFVPAAQAIHYGGASSANAPVRFYIEMQRANLQYWRKHHTRVGVACYFLISCLHSLLRAAGYCLARVLYRPARAVYQHKVRRSVACLKWLLTESSRSRAKIPDAHSGSL